MSEPDPALSTEDRIQWLRDRGVLIDLNDKKSTSSSEITGEPSEDNMMTLSVVMIPADDKEPCEEIKLRVKKSEHGDQLVTALKSIFATNDAIDTKLLEDSAIKQFGNMELRVSDSTVHKVAQEGNVEMFALARPHETNAFSAVNIYLDEAGQLKRLATNSRASAIADLCGFKGVPFVGDVFVGRLKIHNNAIKNVDFHLHEISSDAQWLKGVESQNYSYGVATNRVAMDTDVAPKTGGIDVAKGLTWDEDVNTIDISINRPEDLLSSKDLVVKFQSKSVKLSTKSGSWILEIPLAKSVSPDDCTWTLGKDHIDVTLEKTSDGLWGTLSG